MAFGLLIIYIVLLLVRPQEWWEPVRGYELVNVAAILTVFVTFITKQSQGPSWLEVLRRDKYGRLMWGLLVAVILSQLVKLRLRGAYMAFEQFGKICVLFFLTMILVDSSQRTRRMMWVIVFAAIMLSVNAGLQIATGEGFGGVTPSGSFLRGDFRVVGTGLFNDPNDFALLFILATPFALGLMQTSRTPFGKAFYLLLVPVFAVVLYYTQSRGAVVGFGAMLLAYVWLGGKRTLLRLVMTAVLLAGVVAFGPARARGTVYESSAAGRIEAWGYGNQHLKESPLFGLGYNRWGDFHQLVAHNSLVTCYAELGLVGYFFWLTLLLLTARGLLRVTRLQTELDPATIRLAKGLFAGVVGFGVAIFFLTRTYNPVLFLVLALSCGLIRSAQLRLSTPQMLDIRRKDIVVAAMIALLSIPAIWLVVRVYREGAAG